LADQRANAIYQDQEGTLWFGLQGGQLFLAHKREVRALWPEDSGAQSIFQTACLCRDGSVWGGTDGAGVFCYRNGHWKQYGPKEGLSSQYVFGLYEDSLTNLWAATRGGLFHWDGSRFRRAGFMPRPNGFVLGLFEDRSGALWAATHQGLVRRLGESTTEYAPDNRQGTGPDIRAFAEDPEGNIWVAINGVGIFCQHGSRFEHVFPKAVPGGIDFRAMLFDADGALWVATFGNGLIQIKTNGVRNWTARDGLPSNNLVALVEDKSGMLWFGSHNGIFGLDRNALNNYVPGESSPLLARQLSVAEGLASRICSGWGQPVAGSDQDGRLCFPNQRALAVFDPAAIKSSPLSLPVQIDAIQANGTSVPVGSNSTVRIPSGVRRVAFKYTVADVLNPERVHFRYRLKPVKNDWVDTQNRDVEYDFLPPGDYEFHVMASRSDGVWSESDFPIKLIVTPRLWERTSVRVAVAGLLFGTIAAVAWMVIRARFQRRLLRLEAQQAAELERRRIARDLHDELGSGLTEIMQLGDLGSEEAMAPDDLRGNARTIAQRTRRLAAALDEIVWTTNPRNDSLPKFTGYLCDYAQEFMRPSPVRCRLDVVSVPENIRLKAAVRHNLLLACKEALRNVVRHSGAREVWLRMRYDAGKLQIIVEDDGRGFNSDSLPSRGNGLRNMRERIEACGGKIDFSTALGKGSKLTFELMLGANN
jgi:signal transduction histidine kinase